MVDGKQVPFAMLDVGCGRKPKGDVNVDFFRRGLNPQTGKQIEGDFIVPKEIENFIIADAMYLPFENGAFEVAYSSHAIEHVQNPSAMLKEMSRVSKRKVIIRVPHKKGSAADAPHHVNYFDEAWFEKEAKQLDFRNVRTIRYYEQPLGPKLDKVVPPTIRRTTPWKGLVLAEEKASRWFKVPFEIEVSLKKNIKPASSDSVMFVVAYNNPEILKKSFLSSTQVSPSQVVAYHNARDEALPSIYNKIVREHLNENVWLIFCHQDFVLRENLQLRLKNKDTEAVYGPIGGHPSREKLIGSVIQRDGTPIGDKLKKEIAVQTLDEMCLIAHSEVFRHGLAFDENFKFHFYGADLCMQAYRLGFDVLAMQLDCQHQSRTLHGDLTSQEYLASLELFREKWREFLPIRTTTNVIT